MKYLVTGAAGFIGSNLACKLSELGNNQVLGIDNFSPYYSRELKELRVLELLSPLGIEVLSLDLSNLEQTRKAVRNFAPDFVIHLAAQPGVRTPIGKSFQYIQNNIVSYTNILQVAVEEKIPNFLYASSSSVYGNSVITPYREDDHSIKPISIYGATKLANEILTPSFVSGSATKARGMRFFTVYGPWGRPDMAYFRVINALVNNQTFIKFGTGDVKRDFTYIDDITSSIISLAEDLKNRRSGYSDVVNIGGGKPHSLNELIETIQKQLGLKLEISETDRNPNDTKFTCADISLLQELTKSAPLIELSTGVEKTISWAQEMGIKEKLSSWVDSSI